MKCPICGEPGARFAHWGGDAYMATAESPPGTITLSCRCSLSYKKWITAGGQMSVSELQPTRSPMKLPYAGQLTWLPERTILWTTAGSRAYGTHRPDSDVDMRGTREMSKVVAKRWVKGWT